MNNDCLRGQTALVTGARRGIGKAVAVAFARAGADVAVCDIEFDDGLLLQTLKELKEAGTHSLAIRADISRREDVEAMTRQVIADYGKIDILANCAGVWIPGENLIECSDEHWDKVIDTNLKGTHLCCQTVAKTMISKNGGCIINLSSEVGLTPGPGAGAYSISKAGIIMLTRVLALELAPHNIRVNAIAPGIVKTDFNAAFWKDPKVEQQTSGMVPLRRLAEPDDVAQSALFLASGAAGYITGEVLAVNGGWHPSSSLR